MANQNGIASRKENESCSRMPEGPKVFPSGITGICATALFLIWDMAIIPHISPDKWVG